MKDEKKTKVELIKELTDLRRRFAKLEKSETERQRAEELLLASEARLKALYQGVPSPTFTWQKKGEDFELVDYNNAAKVVSKGEVLKFLGKTANEMYQDRPEILQDIHRCFIENEVIKKEVRSQHFMPGRTAVVTYTFVLPDLIMVHAEDITERKQAESKLMESEERYRTAIEHSNDGVALVQGGRHIYVNQKFLEIFGYNTTEEVIGKTHSIRVHPDDLEMVVERNRARERGESVPSRYEFKGIRKDGTPIYIETSATRVTFQGESVTLAYFRDVTERKQTDEVLESERNLLRNLIDNLPDRIYAKDSEGRFIICNEALARRMGMTSPNELVGKSDFDFLPQELAQRFRTDEQAIIQSGTAMINREEPLVSEGGTITRWNLATKVPLLDKQGNRIGIVGVGREITDRKQAEEALRESEQRLNNILHGSPIPAFVITKDHKVMYWNKALEEMSGIKTEEVIGTNQHWKAFYIEKRPCMADLLVDGEIEVIPQWYEGMYTKSKLIEGAYEATDFFPALGEGGRWLHFTAAIIRSSKGDLIGVLETLEDITERKRMEEQLNVMSIVDELTGLYNRRGFFTLSQQQLKIAERTKKGILLFFADLDNMKRINDTLGHHEGDRALVEIAAILKEIFRESDIIGRIGGDEFAILAIDATDETREVLMERLHQSLEAHNRLKAKNYTLSLCIGIARYDHTKPSSLDELMTQADQLMYEEKRKKQYKT